MCCSKATKQLLGLCFALINRTLGSIGHSVIAMVREELVGIAFLVAFVLQVAVGYNLENSRLHASYR